MQGLLGPNIDRFTLTQEPWSKAAKIGLADTFYQAEQRIQDGVRSGKMVLFRVYDDKEIQCGWLVVEKMNRMFFIWCYQGRGLICLIHQLREWCRVNGYEQLSFFTYKRAALRALRRYRPRVLCTHTPEEVQYVIDVKAAA